MHSSYLRTMFDKTFFKPREPFLWILVAILAALSIQVCAEETQGDNGAIEPGVYADNKGARYYIDRGGLTASGRVAYRIHQDKRGGFHALFMTGPLDDHPFWIPGFARRIGASRGHIYGFFSTNLAEPFCLGAPLSLVVDAAGTIHIRSYRSIHDAVSRNCAFSSPTHLSLEPTHIITLQLLNKDDSRSSPIGANSVLVPGEYDDGTPDHRYRLEAGKAERGRPVWRLTGGERKKNFQGISAFFMGGAAKGHPLFSGRGFDLQMPEGLIYGQLKSGWSADPFCSGAVITLIPVGKLLEVVSFASVIDQSSRSCMFTGGGAPVQEMPTASFTLYLK